MSLAEFKASPWAKSHPLYKAAALSVTPAPEYANSEVLVAGLYRTIGLNGLSEGMVPIKGRDLDRTIGIRRDRRTKPDGASLEGDALHALLHDVLESPKLPNQSTKRFVQVTPLVGETASFSGSARLAGNPWPAGALVRRMVWLGSISDEAAKARWESLFDALMVHDDDDVFARFLRDELSAWTGITWGPGCVLPDANDVESLPPDEFEGYAFPARQFVRDLDAVVAAKPLMTRRQWTSLLEALVRVAAVAHVAWLCEVQKMTWDRVQLSMDGQTVPDDSRRLFYPRVLSYLSYGTGAVSELKDRTSKYLRSRLGMNAVLWSLEEAGVAYAGKLSSADDLGAFCRHVGENRPKLLEVMSLVDDLADREARALLCRKGVGANLMEFGRHVLYQRQAANPILRGYDQGYVLRKRGAAKSSPWVCAPGPVAVLALVHCSLAGLAGPRSVHRLAQHMAAYGIAVDHRDIAQNDLGHQLRMLGLVLDSPDAESGMLLVPPFAVVRQDHTGGAR
ncbi:hypothetical protein JJC00_00825 [Bradyrhizobium diazoefficiens]|uniref:hypothetical protein n=1 Tax=Bradyrhizobium diazoefficiens TaxID=1355477 RepID=UPI001909BA68|nr:hypothetical protein [Bradyrhizobium diazoefficiens]QQO34299.1 hypothetical protein JJC00_00825 [Bradyrhizobium diazoefficiens]